jgi:hypothetical protein
MLVFGLLFLFHCIYNKLPWYYNLLTINQLILHCMSVYPRTVFPSLGDRSSITHDLKIYKQHTSLLLLCLSCVFSQLCNCAFQFAPFSKLLSLHCLIMYNSKTEHTEQQSHTKVAFKIPLYDDKWHDNLLSIRQLNVSKGTDC